MAGQPIKVELVNNPAALGRIKPGWDTLAQQCETKTIFQTFEWNNIWWNAFGNGNRLLVMLAEHDGKPVGIAPLMLSEQRLLGKKYRVVQFIGSDSSDYLDFIIGPHKHDVLRAILDRLVAMSRRWDVISLSNVPQSSTTLSIVDEHFKHGSYPARRSILFECPTYLFGDDVADGQLIRKKSLKRCLNYFQRNGQIEFRQCQTVEEAMSYLDVFFEQHIRRRALTEAPSQFLDERQRVFYRQLVEVLLPAGWLLFSVVLFNQKPIAFHFGFEYANKIIFYKPSFEPEYSRHSPGLVLIRYLLEYALDQHVAEFDFANGQEAYKLRFSNHVRRNEAVRIFKGRPAYYLDHLLSEGRTRIERSPKLLHLARTVARTQKKMYQRGDSHGR